MSKFEETITPVFDYWIVNGLVTNDELVKFLTKELHLALSDDDE